MMRWSKDLIPVEQALTLDGLFWQRVSRSPQHEAYRWFDRGSSTWHSLTWSETAAQVARWRAALLSEALEPGERVAILLRNCPDWVICDQAALSLGLVTVPLYTDDRAENAAFVLRDAAVRILLVQDLHRWKRLADVLDATHPLTRVVLLESSEDAQALAATDARLVVASQWLPQAGVSWSQRSADPDALATIVYTSGTTGKAKGVMLTHHNILSNTRASLNVLDVYQQDIFLSFLPLSHMLERMASYYLPMMSGSTVAYARSIGQLAEDLNTIRPTILIAVPRVFERVYQRLNEQIRTRPAMARWLFKRATEVGWVSFEHTQGRRRWHPQLLLWPWLRHLVARKVLDRLGGKIRVAVSGGAPLPTNVAQLFVGLGLPLIQGYGLTETSPVISANSLENNRPDTVGTPLHNVQVRIGPYDELLVKGPSVMHGYWNNPAATAAIIDADGWLHTGDQVRLIGRHLQITGRLKDILVLSNGEKVPPADMEMAIGQDPLFDQVMVIGEGKAYLSALLVLNATLWVTLAREFTLDPHDPASLQNQHLIKAMLARLREALKDFPGYAKIRRVTLALEPWSIDNGLLTPTLKIKRHQVLERHRTAIEQMYALED
ncbi:AMP-dependent synthetase/ligase [Rhabdochromatium marinum]|uniref:AMP-dependent synthetase/ligase n=1 Tax=Rhabdochromatium marinum TaxID=48729 RepID=UPI0019040931|nr:long-chain fatty acid--CoA ligase [Rhabdochromatium marinum]MBK1648258.1 long-chain fatty acid--CoA ligase [Rhabdochromatium marinum]